MLQLHGILHFWGNLMEQSLGTIYFEVCLLCQCALLMLSFQLVVLVVVVYKSKYSCVIWSRNPCRIQHIMCIE